MEGRRDVDEQGPSWREFSRLEATIKEGFASTHLRLDGINGRVGKTELANENHRARIVSLEKTTFHRRRADVSGQGEEWAERAVSKREGALIGLGLSILVVVLELLRVIGKALWDTLTHHV